MTEGSPPLAIEIKRFSWKNRIHPPEYPYLLFFWKRVEQCMVNRHGPRLLSCSIVT
jgi:hypothetical protein